jgi:hypothetical protein
VDRRPLPEDRVKVTRIQRRDPGGIEVPEPTFDGERAAERLLDGHLLVQCEADEQGQRIVGEQAVGFIVAGEWERDGSVAGRSWAHGSPQVI